MSFRVEHVTVAGHGVQHVIVDGDGHLPELPNRFLKHLSVMGRSPNTQRSYAYGLKEYSCYLACVGSDYLDAGKGTFMGFAAWLQDPTATTNVIPLKRPEPSRSAKTVNNYMAATLSFYRYLFEIGLYDLDLWGEGGIGSPGSSGFKPFLHGFGYRHKGSGFSPYVKEPRTRPGKLCKDEVGRLISACRNSRDRFLLYLLFVSGLRIGEALSLRNEDVVFDQSRGHRVEVRYRGTSENGARVKTGERVVHIGQECIDMLDDYQYDMLDAIAKDSDYLFVKLSGPNAGEPMEYPDVAALFRRLKRRTGIDAHAHALRHAHACAFYRETKDAKALQERLGHSSVQTSMQMYVHLDESELLEDWESAKGAFEIGGADA